MGFEYWKWHRAPSDIANACERQLWVKQDLKQAPNCHIPAEVLATL